MWSSLALGVMLSKMPRAMRRRQHDADKPGIAEVVSGRVKETESIDGCSRQDAGVQGMHPEFLRRVSSHHQLSAHGRAGLGILGPPANHAAGKPFYDACLLHTVRRVSVQYLSCMEAYEICHYGPRTTETSTLVVRLCVLSPGDIWIAWAACAWFVLPYIRAAIRTIYAQSNVGYAISMTNESLNAS